MLKNQNTIYKKLLLLHVFQMIDEQGVSKS